MWNHRIMELSCECVVDTHLLKNSDADLQSQPLSTLRIKENFAVAVAGH